MGILELAFKIIRKLFHKRNSRDCDFLNRALN